MKLGKTYTCKCGVVSNVIITDYDEVTQLCLSCHSKNLTFESTEEYFLTSDGDGHDYIIPIDKKDTWTELWSSVYAEESEEGKEEVYSIINDDFSQYRVEGDWDKEYKIVKR